ncbi:MAG: hypothetical protein IT198_17895 [Acidimicrobiia bacterium]|nr:hypothetical protein [Acidimicrobiia bacterium]
MTRYAEVPLPSLPVREPVPPVPGPGSDSAVVTIVGHGPATDVTDSGERALARCRVLRDEPPPADAPVMLPGDVHIAPADVAWVLDARGLETEGQLAAAVAAAVHLGVAEIHTSDPVTVARAAVTAREILDARLTGAAGEAEP